MNITEPLVLPVEKNTVPLLNQNELDILEAKTISCRNVYDGWQYLFEFDNGYGASIIKHSGSYGGRSGLWELAVVRFYKNDGWHLCYNTPITDDVLGYLSEAEVMNLLKQIKELPKGE